MQRRVQKLHSLVKAVGEREDCLIHLPGGLLLMQMPIWFFSRTGQLAQLESLRGIHDAVNRRNPKGIQKVGWIPQERNQYPSSHEKALLSMGAFFLEEDRKRRLLKEGYLAGFGRLFQ